MMTTKRMAIIRCRWSMFRNTLNRLNICFQLYYCVPEVSEDENRDNQTYQRESKSDKLEFSSILGHFLSNLKISL